MVAVSFLPIFIAGLVSVAIIGIWYHPSVFGGMWMRLAQMTPEAVERQKKSMAKNTVFALLAGMMVAYVMNYFGIAWGVYDILGAIELGFWCWLGFTAPTMLGMVLYEQKPVSYYIIVSGQWLVSFIAIALVLLLL